MELVKVENGAITVSEEIVNKIVVFNKKKIRNGSN